MEGSPFIVTPIFIIVGVIAIVTAVWFCLMPDDDDDEDDEDDWDDEDDIRFAT